MRLIKSTQSFVKELKNLSPMNIVNLITKFNMCDLYSMVFSLLYAFNITCDSVCHVRHIIKYIKLRIAHSSVFLSNIPTRYPNSTSILYSYLDIYLHCVPGVRAGRYFADLDFWFGFYIMVSFVSVLM